MAETLSGFKLALRVVFSLLKDYQQSSVLDGALADLPCVRDAHDMIYITQRKLEQLVCHDASSITEAKERVIGKDGSQTHRAGMQDSFVAQITEGCMPVDDLDLFPDKNLP